MSRPSKPSTLLHTSSAGQDGPGTPSSLHWQVSPSHACFCERSPQSRWTRQLPFISKKSTFVLVAETDRVGVLGGLLAHCRFAVEEVDGLVAGEVGDADPQGHGGGGARRGRRVGAVWAADLGQGVLLRGALGEVLAGGVTGLVDAIGGLAGGDVRAGGRIQRRRGVAGVAARAALARAVAAGGCAGSVVVDAGDERAARGFLHAAVSALSARTAASGAPTVPHGRRVGRGRGTQAGEASRLARSRKHAQDKPFE